MRQVETDQRAVEAWIPGDIQTALAAEPYEATDKLYGQGEGYWFGPTLETRIELYPEHKTTIYEDPNIYLVVFKPSRLIITEDAVFVSTKSNEHDSHVSFGRDGTLSVMSQGPRLNGGVYQKETEASAQDAGATPAPSVEPITEAPVSDSAVESGREHAIEVQVLDGRSKPKKQPRVELTGRLGRPPHFRETPRGKLIARFPIAEHSKDETNEEVTVWFTVVAFNALAASLREAVEAGEIAQGQELKVVGYRHNRMVPDGKGGMKPQEEIFAAVVKRPKQKGGQ